MLGCPFRFQRWFCLPGTALLMGGVGISSFIAALIWQAFGAVPCPFCEIERALMLFAGVFALLGFLWQGRHLQSALLVSGFCWLAAVVVLMRHIAVQYHLVALPKMCIGELPGTVAEMEAFLEHKPQASCDEIQFLVFGLPPTVYLLALCLACFALCLFVFLRRDEGAQK